MDLPLSLQQRTLPHGAIVDDKSRDVEKLTHQKIAENETSGGIYTSLFNGSVMGRRNKRFSIYIRTSTLPRVVASDHTPIRNTA